MVNKPSYEELEQRVKELKEQAAERKVTEEALRESLKLHHDQRRMDMSKFAEEEIAKWKDKRKAEMQEEIDEITDYLRTPEGREYILYLRREDGR